MRALSNVFKVLMWVALVIYLFFQSLAVYGLMQNNTAAMNAEKADKIYNVVPLICAAALMLVAVILYIIFKKHRYIGIVVAIIAAAFMLIIALDLGRNFPVTVSGSGKDTGLTTAKLFFNHIGIAIIPVFMIISLIFERIANKNEEKARAMAKKSEYHFSDEMIFTDVDENGKPTNNKGTNPHHLKRSLRKKFRKE